MPADAAMAVFTPDDLMGGEIPTGQVVLFDDDHYYMGGVLAELLVENGAKVTLVTRPMSPTGPTTPWSRPPSTAGCWSWGSISS